MVADSKIAIEKQLKLNNWLPRYTGKQLDEFGQYILLTNFGGYVKMFAEWNGVEIDGQDRPMQSATYDGITIINFSMGSAMAATIMDLLSAIDPKAVLFLGKCGGLKKKNEIGDLTKNQIMIKINEMKSKLPKKGSKFKEKFPEEPIKDVSTETKSEPVKEEVKPK